MRSRISRPVTYATLAATLITTFALTLSMTPARASDAALPPKSAKPTATSVPSASQDGDPGSDLTDVSEATTRVPRELLVRFAPGVASSDRASVRSGVGARLLRTLPLRGLELLKVDRRAVAAMEALERRPEVLYTEPNFVYSTSATSDDPKLPQLWGLHNTGQVIDGQAGTADADIDAPEAWNNSTGRAAVTVAVVDTGIAYDHPDLAGNIWTNPNETVNGLDDDGNGYVDDVRGWDWSGGDSDPQDMNGHGTHVAGTIGAAGNDGKGVTGVAWDVSLMPLRVLGADGSGTLADIVAGFAYAGAAGADVVNASFGGSDSSQAMSDAIAASPQTLFVVAAGNSTTNNDTAPTYPCSYLATNLVCVAATDNQDRLASFSNYGAAAVDLAAPGVGILSTVPAQTTLMSDGFDGTWADRWYTGGTRAWGIESSSSAGPYVADSPNVAYAAYANSWVRPRTVLDFTGLKGCRLDYLLALDTEAGYDGLLVEAAVVGGYWRTVASWTGSSGGWIHVQDSLADFDGESAVLVRFRLVSDGSVQRSGAYVDDVAVSCMGTAYKGDEYASLDGTSMASPHVAGAAALLFAAAPDATVAAVRSALLDGAETKSSLDGKTATGGRLNVSKALDILVPMVRLSSSSHSVQENSGSAGITVERTGDLSLPVAVDYTASGGTARQGSDYEPVSGSLSFAAGDATATFTVPILDDDVFDGDKSIDLALSRPTGVPLGAPSSGVVTIRDDETPAVVTFQQSARAITENAGVVNVTVTRTGNLQAPASVDYARTSGTATAGSDFTLAPRTLTFEAGETSKTIPLSISDDAAREGAETVVLSLTSRQADTSVGTVGSTALTIAVSDQRPDALISTGRTWGYIGNDVYTTSGAKQTKSLGARRTVTRTFYVRVANDGNVTNSIAVTGGAAEVGSQVKYFSGTTNVSNAMRSAAGWSVRLAPGKHALVTVKIKVLSRAAIGSVKQASVRGTWTGDGTRRDVATARVTVVR